MHQYKLVRLYTEKFAKASLMFESKVGAFLIGASEGILSGIKTLNLLRNLQMEPIS